MYALWEQFQDCVSLLSWFAKVVSGQAHSTTLSFTRISSTITEYTINPSSLLYPSPTPYTITTSLLPPSRRIIRPSIAIIMIRRPVRIAVVITPYTHRPSQSTVPYPHHLRKQKAELTISVRIVIGVVICLVPARAGGVVAAAVVVALVVGAGTGYVVAGAGGGGLLRHGG